MRPHPRLLDVGIGQARAQHQQRKQVERFIPSREPPTATDADADAVDPQTSQDSYELKWTPS